MGRRKTVKEEGEEKGRRFMYTAVVYLVIKALLRLFMYSGGPENFT